MGTGKTWGRLVALELMMAINYIFHSPIDTWKVTVNNSPLKALVGDNVTIPCHVSGHLTPLNLQVVQAIWTMRSPDQRVRTVYHFESFRHFPIRPGTRMSDGNLQVGDASLYIPRVEIGDDGDYICSFTISPDVKSGTTAVHVSDSEATSLRIRNRGLKMQNEWRPCSGTYILVYTKIYSKMATTRSAREVTVM